MKEPVGKFLRIIVAIAAVVVGVLIWKEVISLPLGLVGLFAAAIYYFIDLFVMKKKEDKQSVEVVQKGKQSISLVNSPVTGGININPDPKPYLETIKELQKEKDVLHEKKGEAEIRAALAEHENIELKRALYEANKEKLDAENANLSEQPDYKQLALKLRDENKLEEAINSVNTDSADEESAKRHIFKAELLIDNFQFDEAEKHYIKAVTIFPSYDNNNAIAGFYYNLNRFTEAIPYYKRSLVLANSPQEKAATLNDMGNAQWKNNDFSNARVSYEEALKIYRQLAETNPQAYLPDVATTLNNLAILHSSTGEFPKALEEYEEALKICRQLAETNPQAYEPDVAMTLNNLAIFYIYSIPNKELSLQYALEAVEVLGKCKDIPVVRKYLQQAKQIIEQWDK